MPPYAAVTVTEVGAATTAVGTLNVCEVKPAVTVTLAVGNAAAEPVSVTAAPPGGLDAVRVTVTFTLVPPTTVLGETDTDDTVGPVDCTIWMAETLALVTTPVN